MDEISHIIGLQFETPDEICERNEWLPCAKLQESRVGEK